MGDRIQLEQVVLNLLQNACQALPDAGRGVRITTAREHGKGAHGAVRVEVSDEGSGIAPEDLARITDPFFTTKRRTGGTGLGLAISRRIVKSHGGSLSFRSTVGVGTGAVVTLPAAGPSNAAT